MKRLVKVLKLIATALLCLILAANMITIIFSALGLREPLKWLPYALLSVKSGSMEPVFSAGDALFVYEAPYDALKTGDIITFHRGTEFITHEIVGEDNNKYITKGRANNYKDEAVGPEEYCAKVMFIIPGAGWLLEFLAKPMELLLISILLFALLYGKPALAYIYDKLSKSNIKPFKMPFNIEARRSGLGRFIALFTGISLFAVLPFMTAAKYTARLNEYATLYADSINFKSNLLTEAGSEYYVRGWKGDTYSFKLEIMNYNNDLLTNMDDQDLIYGLCVEPIEAYSGEDFAVYGEAYEISLTPLTPGLEPLTGAGVPYSFPAGWPVDYKYGPYLISGSDDMKLKHEFKIELTALHELAPGAKVRFNVMAATSEQNQFFIELLGKYTLEVMNNDSFLGTRDISQSLDSALVTYKLSTNLIDDGDSMKNVQISWNEDKLYINQYEPVASAYYVSGNSITIPMQAFSNVTLEFFKHNLAVNIEDTDITATVSDD